MSEVKNTLNQINGRLDIEIKTKKKDISELEILGIETTQNKTNHSERK